MKFLKESQLVSIPVFILLSALGCKSTAPSSSAKDVIATSRAGTHAYIYRRDAFHEVVCRLKCGAPNDVSSCVNDAIYISANEFAIGSLLPLIKDRHIVLNTTLTDAQADEIAAKFANAEAVTAERNKYGDPTEICTGVTANRPTDSTAQISHGHGYFVFPDDYNAKFSNGWMPAVKVGGNEINAGYINKNSGAFTAKWSGSSHQTITYPFVEGRALVSFTENGKRAYRIIDDSLNEIGKIDGDMWFDDDILARTPYLTGGHLIGSKGSGFDTRYYIVSSDGTAIESKYALQLFAYGYKGLAGFGFPEGLAVAHPLKYDPDAPKPVGYINARDELVIPSPVYNGAVADFLDDFSDGLARVSVGGFAAYIKPDGTYAIPPGRYIRGGKFHEGYAWVVKAGATRSTIVDKNGTEKVTFPDKSYFSLSTHPAARVVLPVSRQDDLFYRHIGHTILSVDEYFGLMSEGLFMVWKETDHKNFDFLGFHDQSGTPVVQSTATRHASEIRRFTGGLAPFYSEGKWGFLSKNGAEFVPSIYSAVAPYAEGVALATSFIGGEYTQQIIDSVGRVTQIKWH